VRNTLCSSPQTAWKRFPVLRIRLRNRARVYKAATRCTTAPAARFKEYLKDGGQCTEKGDPTSILCPATRKQGACDHRPDRR
jgi:hypothetical protein